MKRVLLADAALLLGLSVDAVRKRISRGTLKAEKDGGAWYVYLDTEPDNDRTTVRTKPDNDQAEQDTEADRLRARIERLEAALEREREARERERERFDVMIMQMMQRIPALTAGEPFHDATAGATLCQEAPTEPGEADIPSEQAEDSTEIMSADQDQAEQIEGEEKAAEIEQTEATTEEPKRRRRWWLFGR